MLLPGGVEAVHLGQRRDVPGGTGAFVGQEDQGAAGLDGGELGGSPTRNNFAPASAAASAQPVAEAAQTS